MLDQEQVRLLAEFGEDIEKVLDEVRDLRKRIQDLEEEMNNHECKP